MTRHLLGGRDRDPAVGSFIAEPICYVEKRSMRPRRGRAYAGCTPGAALQTAKPSAMRNQRLCLSPYAPSSSSAQKGIVGYAVATVYNANARIQFLCVSRKYQ
jgi:hypothetical protein